MNRAPLYAYALLSFATLAWAGNFIVGRYIHEQVTPVTLSYGRWSLALAILLPFTLRGVLRQLDLVRENIWLFVVLGVAGMTVFHSLVYTALESTGAINAALILSMTPAVIVALSWLLDRESINLVQAAGIGISLVGAVILITRGDMAVIRAMDFNRGDLWMIVAMPNWALYCVLLRRMPRTIRPMVVLTVTMAMGVAFLTPVFVYELIRGSDFRFNAQTTLSVIYVALFASVIAYICWNRGVALVGPNRAGLFMHLVPAFSAVLAIVVLGESIGTHHVVGLVLIITGIYLTTSHH